MVGKRKRIPHDSSSEASTDNPQIRAAPVIPSSNTVVAVISLVNTQGSANGEPKIKGQRPVGRILINCKSNLVEEMLSMKNETTLPDGTVTLTDDEIVLGVLGHKFGYFKGPSKSVSREHTMLDKHLEEKLETQQQELVTTKQELVETKQELGEAKQEIQELKKNQKKFEELLHKIMEGQQPPP
ncbi:hypothetical protein C1H46_042935 [Malus baccata]|uniref:Uncharacterized protein n=1 Tax=Malus baccata TaxID=106549 RepID=A0A540KBD8_MALBA|nr:hypothetical protein C1H46_042935 [Malus baccata]